MVKAVVKEIEYKLDVNSLLKEPAPEQAQLNDIIKVKVYPSITYPEDFTYADKSFKLMKLVGNIWTQVINLSCPNDRDDCSLAWLK